MNEERRFRRRLALLVTALSAGALLIAGRLVHLQVLGAEGFRLRARDQHEGKIRIEGRRGTIFDRNGRELAVSVATKSAYVHPRLIASESERERIVSGVASALSLPPHEIRTLIGNPRNRNFVFLRRRLTPSEELALQELRIPALGWMNDSRRFYPRGSMAAHLVGFVDIDAKGQAGIERAFDEALRGDPTFFVSLVDARQRPLIMRAAASGLPGRDLVLTIDEYIQHLAETELERAMAETGSRAGTVIVMDPRNGEILALCNRPGFDPNQPATSKAQNRENLAVSYGYEPGSTFKIFTAAAALEENLARPNEAFDCGMGSITLFGRRVGDHQPFTTLSLAQIIMRSSNVGIIRVGQRIPERKFLEYVDRFGFGARTGVGLPSEAPGLVQRPGGRTWSGLSQAMMSMGQSIFVTPLQLLTAASAIGRGGQRVMPHAILSIVGPDGSHEKPDRHDPVRVVSQVTASALTRMMEAVVEEGTGKAASIPGYRVAGKTGTAQKVVNRAYSHSAHVASFVGFAPSRDPVIAAVVVLDEPQGKYYGGEVAAPLFARVVGPALAHLRVPPTEPVARPGEAAALMQAGAEAGGGRSPRAVRVSLRPPDESLGEARIRPFPAPWPPSLDVTEGLVPDVYGCSLRHAVTALARAGCAARVSGTGFVTDQIPKAGSPIAEGTVCQLFLAPALAASHGALRGM